MKQSNIEDFSSILRQLIESTGLSIYEISRAAKISCQAMSGYCNNKSRPNMEQLIKLADYFAVPIDYLVGRCGLEEAKAIADNYSAHFMELRRAPFEAYLAGRSGPKIAQSGKGEPPWPYNLMGDVFGEPWIDVLTDDQFAGINAAIADLTDREKEAVLLYYRDGLTLAKISGKYGVTLERVHQIIGNAVRKLRAPHRTNLMMHGVKGAEERNYLTHYRNELDKQAAALQAYEKQLTEKKAQLFDAAIGTSAPNMPDNAWGMDLSEMDLSVRSYNCLHRRGCRTLGDVINVVKSGNLLYVRNLGRKSAEEILGKIYCLTGKRYTETGEEIE